MSQILNEWDNVLWLFIIVLMLGALGKLLVSTDALPPQKSPTKKSSAKEDQASELVYQLRSPLFTPAEKVLYTALSEAVFDNQLVFGKVRVADVLQPAAGLSKSRWQAAFNRISAKHFDYVICDKDTLSILIAIELQDKSHHQPHRLKRDQFLKGSL